MAIQSIATAIFHGARQKQACEIIGITPRTLQYWRVGGVTDQRQTVKKEPANRLSEQERESILAVCNSEEFRNQPPTQIVPTLADSGCFLASESSFYRILRQADQLQHRGRSAEKMAKERPEPYVAKGPNQVWSWDITYCAPILCRCQG